MCPIEVFNPDGGREVELGVISGRRFGKGFGLVSFNSVYGGFEVVMNWTKGSGLFTPTTVIIDECVELHLNKSGVRIDHEEKSLVFPDGTVLRPIVIRK